MIQIKEYPGSNILETTIKGTFKEEDVEELKPILERKVDRYNTLKWIFEMKDFEGITAKAFAKEAKLELENLKDMEKVAVVGDQDWHKWVTKAMKPFMPEHTQLMFFKPEEKEMAHGWMTN